MATVDSGRCVYDPGCLIYHFSRAERPCPQKIRNLAEMDQEGRSRRESRNDGGTSQIYWVESSICWMLRLARISFKNQGPATSVNATRSRITRSGTYRGERSRPAQGTEYHHV